MSQSRTGEYIWGRNGPLFAQLTRLRTYAEATLPELDGRQVRWLIAPDPSGDRATIAWTHEPDPDLVFVVNFAPDRSWPYFGIPGLHDIGEPGSRLRCEFSTAGGDVPPAPWNGHQFWVDQMGPGEARAYRLDR